MLLSECSDISQLSWQSFLGYLLVMGTTYTNSSIDLVLVTLLRPLNASSSLSRFGNGLPHSVSFKHEVLTLTVSASLL